MSSASVIATLNTMFSSRVNTVCINALFSRGTIDLMTSEGNQGSDDPVHEQMERCYLAANLSGHVPHDKRQVTMARLLNSTSQAIKNWEKRGPSKEGLLQLQDTIGVNASWVTSGVGPMFIEGAICTPAPGAPYPTRPASAFVLAEESHRYSTWPFSEELRRRMSNKSPEELLHIENVIRAHLRLAPLDSNPARASA